MLISVKISNQSKSLFGNEGTMPYSALYEDSQYDTKAHEIKKKKTSKRTSSARKKKTISSHNKQRTKVLQSNH